MSCKKSKRQMKPHSKTSPWQHTAITCYQSVRFCPQAAASVFRLFSQIAIFHFLGRAWRKLSKPWEFLKPSDLKRREIREKHRKTMSNFVNMSGQPRATEGNHDQSCVFQDVQRSNSKLKPCVVAVVFVIA